MGPVSAATGDITTAAGSGLGPGPATSLAQVPGAIALSGTSAYVTDDFYNVVRVIDLDRSYESVIAGTGVAGFSGDGGPAKSAKLNMGGNRTVGGVQVVGGSGGIAVGPSSSLFIADRRNNRIRKIDGSGIITTVAGNGTACDPAKNLNCGDGGPATSAQLNEPSGVAVDALGNLFIADRSNNRVRRVTPAGTITTVAGNGVLASSGDRGPATLASVLPVGLTFSSRGELFVSELPLTANNLLDGDGGRVRKIVPGADGVISGAIDAIDETITTVAGTGTSDANLGTGIPIDTSVGQGDGGPAILARIAPSALAIDPSGGLVVTEFGRVRRVSPGADSVIDGSIDEIIITVAGTGPPTPTSTRDQGTGDGGPATSATLGLPPGVAFAASGTMFIADRTAAYLGGDTFGAERIRKVVPGSDGVVMAGADQANEIITTVAGTGSPLPLHLPKAVALDAFGNLFIGSGDLRIRRADASDSILIVAGDGFDGSDGDGGPASRASLGPPGHVIFDRSGNLFVAEPRRIRRIVPGADGVINGGADELITTVAGTGVSSFGGDGGPATAAQFASVDGMAFDARGSLFVSGDGRVRRINPGADGLVDGGADEIITTVVGIGGFESSGDGGPGAEAGVRAAGVAFAPVGDLFVVDKFDSVRRVVPGADGLVNGGADEIITTAVGISGDGCPRSDPSSCGDGGPATSAKVTAERLAIDVAGNMFLSSPEQHYVRSVTPGADGLVNGSVDDLINTKAGIPGQGGFSGDGGPATSAKLYTPTDLAADPAGNLFIVDSQNGRIRKVQGSLRAVADFDGGGTTDVSVFRPGSGTWFVRNSTPESTVFGTIGDMPVAADYDGDGKTDVAVFRPSNGTWFVRPRNGSPDISLAYGTNGDLPVPADYDGDGKADMAVFRPSSGTWFVHQSSNSVDVAFAYGTDGDIPVPGTYSGGSTTQLAVFRPSSGTWFVRGATPESVTYGTKGDVPVPADYDGNGTTDIGVFRPSSGTWFVRGATPEALSYGTTGDVPVPGRYDADRKADKAVFRPSTGTWYVRQSTDGTDGTPSYGLPTDVPAPQPAAIRRFFF